MEYPLLLLQLSNWGLPVFSSILHLSHIDLIGSHSVHYLFLSGKGPLTGSRLHNFQLYLPYTPIGPNSADDIELPLQGSFRPSIYRSIWYIIYL